MKVFPAKSYPDQASLDYALHFARGANMPEAVKHLERIKARSNAYATSYGTHIPLLASVVAVAPPGDVLELGAGHSSSPLLSELCLTMGRKLITLERPGEWFDCLDDLVADHHERRQVTDPFCWKPTVEALLAEHGEFAVAFVDHGLDRTDGAEVLLALKGKVKRVVVHDTRNTWFAGIDDVLNSYKYRYDYMKMTPCTSVVSEEEF